MKEFEHFKQSQERKNTLKTLVSGTTSGEVTEFIHQYYAERPQLDKPKENVMGFEVQKELLPLLKTLVNHVCH